MAAVEAYACHTLSNTTLTFYYDGQRASRTGTTYNLTTATTRANTMFKSVGRSGNEVTAVIDGMTLTPGDYFLAASSTSDEFTVNADYEVIPLPVQAYDPTPADG